MRPTLKLLLGLLFVFFIKTEMWAGNTCNTATPIANNLGQFETHSNLGTNNSGVPAPPCGNYISNDFWFSTTVPASGFLSVVLLPGTMTNPALAVYSGSCSNLNLMGCSSEDLCGNASAALYEGNGLTPGTTVYIRVWAVGGAPNGNFEIRVSNSNPPPFVPLGLDVLVGTASNNGNCVQLTTATNTQLGCAWDSQQQDMTQTFEKVFVLNFGTNNGGADGITVGFQNDPAGTSACGNGGGGIGAEGIINSFIVEFDTWDNNPVVGEIADDHAAIYVNGTVNSATPPINGPVSLNGGNIEDGQDHLVRIKWNGTTFAYEVYFDEVLIMNGTYDIVANCLGGNPLAYWGTTSSTGGANNNQSICPYTPDPYYGGMEQFVDATICEGDTYFAGGSNQTTSGIYSDNSPLPNGCLNVTTTTLTVIPSGTSTVNETVCIGDCINIGSDTYCNTGTFMTTLPNANYLGCDSIVTLNLTVLNPLSQISQNPQPTIDCSNPTVFLDGTLSSNVGSTTYLWTGPCVLNGEFTPVAEVACAGLYTLTVTQIEGNVVCTNSSTIDVFDNAILPIADAGLDQVLDCSTGCTFLDATMSSSGPSIIYSWTGPNGFSSSLQNPEVCETGNYTLSVYNSNNNCIAGDVVTVTGSSAPIADAGLDGTVDCTNTTATLDGSGSDMGPVFTLVWLDASGTQVGTGPTFTTGIAGTYTLVVTNTTNGCSTTDEAIISGNSILPTADAGADVMIDCNNASATLDGSNSDMGTGFTLVWLDASGMQIGTGATLNTSDVGTYTLVVTNTNNGCSSQDDAIVSGNANLPTANAGADFIIDCNNLLANLDGSGSDSGTGFTLIWIDASGTPVGSGTNFNTANTGTYTLVVTNTANGCSSQDDVIVTENTTPPNADAGADFTIDCNNLSANLDGSNSDTGTGFTLVWLDSNGLQVGTGTTLNTSDIGTYTLVVTNTTTGCSAMDNAIVSENNTLPIANAGADFVIDCTNSSATLDGSGSDTGTNFILVWLDGSGMQVGTGTTLNTPNTGIYTLVVTNTITGCSAMDDAIVSGTSNLPIADAGVMSTLTCDILNVTLNGSNSSTGANFSYEWQNSSGDSLGNDVLLDVSDPDTYTLIVTDISNGCSQSATVTIDQNITPPTADAGTGGTLSCTATSITLDGSNSSQGGFNYNWFNSNNTNIGSGSIINVSSSDTFTLVVTSTVNGCSASDDVIITQDTNVPTVTANSNGDLTCSNVDVTLDGTGSSSGTNIIYEWFDDQNVSLGGNISINTSESGTYTFVVTDNSTGCSSSTDVVVMEYLTEPTVIIQTPSQLTCTDLQSTLDGSSSSSGANFNYEWFDSANMPVGSGSIINVSEAGFYTLVVTNSTTGCSNLDSIEVTQDGNVPVANIDLSTDVLNCNDVNILLQNSGSSTGTDIIYSWSDATGVLSTASNLNVTTLGDYTLTVSNNANGCSTMTSVSISQDTISPQIITNSETITCDQPTSLLDGTGSTSGTEIIYEWQNNMGGFLSDDISFEVNQSGNYNFIITDNSNGCSTSAVVTVDENITNVISNAGNNATLTCGTTSVQLDGSNSTSSATINYQWINSAGIPMGNDPLLDASVADTFYLIVTDTQNGCADTSSTIVAQDANLPTPIITNDGILTCINEEVNLDGSTSTGIGTLDFEWTDPNGLSIVDQTNINAIIIGNYELVVTDQSNGCSATTTFLVEENIDPPLSDAGQNDTIDCNITMATLDGSNSDLGTDYSYQWISPNGTPVGIAPILNTSESGIFSLTVTNNVNGCTDISEVEVIQSADLPTAIIIPPSLITCTQNNVDLIGSTSTGIGQLSFQWYILGQQIGNTPTLNVSQSGTYILDVTDLSNGCVTSTSVLVEDNLTPPIAGTNDDGAITCTQSFYEINASNSSVGSNFQYEWLDPTGVTVSNNFSFDATDIGFYNLIVTDISNGCNASTSIEITEDLIPPDALPTVDGILTCVNLEVELDAIISAATSYEWLDPSGSSISTSSTVLVDDIGLYQLIATDDGNGCTATQLVLVEENITSPTPLIDAITDLNLSCDQNSLVVDGSNSIPIGNVTYEWTLNNVLISTVQNPQIDEAGILTLTVTDTQNGCSESTSVMITQDDDLPEIEFENPDMLTCVVTSLDLDASNSSTGIDLEYLWTGPGAIQNSTTLTPTISQPGTYTLTILNTTNGCEVSEEIIIEEDITPPVAIISPADEFDCTTFSVALDASNSSVGNNFTYQWTTANGTISGNQNTLNTTVSEIGFYTLEITNTTNGCTISQSITVEADDNVLESADFLINQPPCFGDQGSIIINNIIGGTPPYMYSVDNQPFTSNPNINSLEPGSYNLLIEDAQGCQYSEEFTILDVPELIVDLPASITIELGENYELFPQINYPSNAIDTFYWTSLDSLDCYNCLNPIAAPYNTSLYTFTVINLNGCKTTANILVNVEKPRNVFIPNVFTPNDDGFNDIFYINAKDLMVKQVNKFQIFTRWGELVFADEDFQPNTPDHGWDGFFKGEKLNPNVFVYYAEIEFIDGVVKIYKGDVTLRK
ncbi:MAG: gliding motility-associated C-terminal domain-containing protein [Saprospiraceae bacterium]